MRIASDILSISERSGYNRPVARCYDQYCPMAHALDLVGERWSLLIVRELLEDDQLRYSDLHARLRRLRHEHPRRAPEDARAGRRRPPPASSIRPRHPGSTSSPSTARGSARCSTSSRTGARGRSAHPPTTGDLEPGWLPGALRIALPVEHGTRPDRVPDRRRGRRPWSTDEIVRGPIENPDAVIVGERLGLLPPAGRARPRRRVDRGRRRRRARDARVASRPAGSP